MEPQVTETTNPATADFGMRTFDVQLSGSQVIEIAISQRVQEACDGEIHPVDGLNISNHVVSNGDLLIALCQLLQAVYLTGPNTQSLSESPILPVSGAAVS
jgi:hypothetical protein